MELVTKLFTSLIAFSLLASPAAALSGSAGTSTTATTTNNSGSSGGSAVGTGVAVGLGVVGAGILGSGLVQKTALHSFGGKVAAIIPCISPLGPSLWVSIVPAGAMPISYIWTPVTVTKLNGPPSHPGQQILGVADIPYVCWNVVSGGLFGLFDVFSYLYGLRMTVVGTSL